MAATIEELLSARDLAGVLGVSVRSIWRWVSSGRLPKPDLRYGQLVRWRPETITAWIANGGQIDAE